jgi:ornithine cyclodeaminase
MTPVPPFAVISGAQVARALHGQEKQITELVEATYRWHGAGDSVNPPSYFLRFPDRPSSRIIALPASLGGQVRVDGPASRRTWRRASRGRRRC